MHVKRSCMLPKSGPPLAELSELSTSELVALAQAGNREAFDPLYRRFAPRLLAWAAQRTGSDRALAEDVVSETWVAALAAIGQWHDDGTEEGFARWLFGVARAARHRVCGARWREVASENTAYWEDSDRLANIPQSPAELVEPTDKQDMIGQLHAAIERLSPVARDVVRMRLNGMAQTAVARELGLSIKQVDCAWRYAHTSLRKQLAGSVDIDCPQEERARMRLAAQSLAPRMRQVALLRLDGMRPCDIAKATGLSALHERQAWQRARDVLRKRLDDPAAARRTDAGRLPDKQRAALLAAAQSLAPRMRQVALLRLDGMRPSEIERHLGCSRNTVRAGWQRAQMAFVRQGLIAA